MLNQLFTRGFSYSLHWAVLSYTSHIISMDLLLKLFLTQGPQYSISPPDLKTSLQINPGELNFNALFVQHSHQILRGISLEKDPEKQKQ